MKVLHVNNVDLPGRRFSGYDLLHELAPRGVVSKQIVMNKLSDDANVVQLLGTPGDEALQASIAAAEARHSMNNLLYPWGQVLAETEEFREADVIHYHLIHNQMVSLFDLPRLFDLKPSVWSLHDPWAMTGHCVYPMTCDRWLTGCDACPSLDVHFALAIDRANQMWRIKQRVFSECDVDIVVASEFMLDLMRRSPLTAGFDRTHLIPFAVETGVFLPDESRVASRRLLGIPEHDFVVLLRATAAEFKGVRYALEALGAGAPSVPTTLLTVDQAGLAADLSDTYNVVDLGWVDDAALYPRVYSACDVLLMPSTAEAFGLMAIEAMAAGRPVICFEGTSLPSVTCAPECGIAVPMGDSPALRRAIDRLAGDPDEVRRRGALGRTIAAERYNHERYLDALVSLYQGVLERSRNRSRPWGSRPAVQATPMVRAWTQTPE